MILPFGNPERYLSGTFIGSYSGYLRAEPAYKAAKLVPQFPAYIQQDPPNSGQFQQVPGFVPIGFVGWLRFSNGLILSGSGSSQVGGSKAALDASFSGTVTQVKVEGSFPFAMFLSGAFITVDSTDPSITFTHKFILSSDRNTLVFTVTDGGLRDMVASGVMKRIGLP